MIVSNNIDSVDMVGVLGMVASGKVKGVEGVFECMKRVAVGKIVKRLLVYMSDYKDIYLYIGNCLLLASVEYDRKAVDVSVFYKVGGVGVQRDGGANEKEQPVQADAVLMYSDDSPASKTGRKALLEEFRTDIKSYDRLEFKSYIKKINGCVYDMRTANDRYNKSEFYTKQTIDSINQSMRTRNVDIFKYMKSKKRGEMSISKRLDSPMKTMNRGISIKPVPTWNEPLPDRDNRKRVVLAGGGGVEDLSNLKRSTSYDRKSIRYIRHSSSSRHVTTHSSSYRIMKHTR